MLISALRMEETSYRVSIHLTLSSADTKLLDLPVILFLKNINMQRKVTSEGNMDSLKITDTLNVLWFSLPLSSSLLGNMVLQWCEAFLQLLLREAHRPRLLSPTCS